MKNYRKLNIAEINQLTTQFCTAEDWSKINVVEGFSPDHITHTRFSGEIELGIFEKEMELPGGLKKKTGLHHVTLHNCSNSLIENIPNYIANYRIGSDCFIQNVNLILTEGESCFGNNTEVSVLNETGGREVPIYNRLSAQLAYIIAMYRHRPDLIARLREMIEAYSLAQKSCYGKIGNGVHIVNTGTIRNVCIGDYCQIDGTSRLENGSINSNREAPVYIGPNVTAEDFIVSSGAHISDGVVMSRCFIGQACHLTHLFSAHDSLFFSNCQSENGEACAIFAGPYTVTMHKSSLLIAGMFSFLNAGSGSNQSNHMYKLGPIHQGVVERGSKTTSDSYILWPAKVGAFSLIMGPGVTSPVYKLMFLGGGTREIDEGVKRIDRILDEKPVPETTLPQTPQSYDIEFRDVSFSYESKEQVTRTEALRHISFKASQGEITALVGPSGSGKSTVASLIPRFWDVGEGGIYIGGVDVRNIKTEELMNLISFVFQDTFLFYDTLYENIAVGSPNATREQVEAATRAAQCHEFISNLPDGYDTRIGDKGVFLSGGEAQRICVARAILKNAPILVLDEATAFADPENEYKMQQALQHLIKNKTVIIIAHRLSSIVSAQQIVVLKEGSIAQIGTHQKLSSIPGVYRQMWEAYTDAFQWELKTEYKA